MRKHISYYYKCYDGKNNTNLEKMETVYFNDYGYNFDCQNRKFSNWENIGLRKR